MYCEIPRIRKTFSPDALNPAVRLVVASLVFMLSIFATGHAAENDRRYGPYTLAEWRNVIKNIDYSTLGEPSNVQGLIEIVADETVGWASRRQAAETLGRIGKPAASAIPTLKTLLSEPGEDAVTTRLWVLKSLSLFGDVAQDLDHDVSRIILDDSLPHLARLNAMETLGRIGKNGTVALATFSTIINEQPIKIDGKPNELRLGAVEAVWILGQAGVPLLPALMNTAQEEWSPMRLATMVTIGQMGPRAEIAIPLLVDTVLFDEAGEVQEVAADALGKIGPSAFPVLTQMLEDREERVRRYAVRALTQAGPFPQVNELLLGALQDQSELVQVDAADELLARDSQSVPAQRVLLSHLGSGQRRVALDAYTSIFRHVSSSESLDDFLRQLASDKDIEVQKRSAARKLLMKKAFAEDTIP